MSILEVHDVSIRYMTGDFKDIGLKEYLTRRIRHNYHINEFWADKNISFSLEKGDMLGIIGANGAGKSTLLKAISGIMAPTKGWVKRDGNIAALLELASGFDGDLTVRENAYLRGAMLGYTRKFMDETYDQIIDFAELRDFQDRPFKQLSSGMKSRLAFAIASLVHPDILILDEVLSVGDGAFQSKSAAKMREIIQGGATTILVSHSLGQVREMCNKVLWLHRGEQICFSSEVEYVCDLYTRFLQTGNGELLKPTNSIVWGESRVFSRLEVPETFDILGSCVARDIFGFHTESTDFQVKRFIQSNSPISMLSPSLQEIGLPAITEEDCADMYSFWKRMVITDLNKTGFSQLMTSRADWLILDTSEIEFDLLHIRNQKINRETYATYIKQLRNSIPIMKSHGILDECTWEKLNILTLSEEEIRLRIQKYIDVVKEIYPETRIILLEVRNTLDYLEDGTLRLFTERARQLNALLEKCFTWVIELLPNSPVIRMPDGVYGDAHHKWGQEPRHYDRMYYEYALQAVHIVTSADIQNKEKKLSSLREQYSIWYQVQRKHLVEEQM